MLKVNLHNYEAYFLDYVEGNLSNADREEVEKFLALYPDKFDELQEFENITVPVEGSMPFDKSMLKKGLSDISAISDDNFEEFCIANLEGDLDEKASEQYLNHVKQFPEKKKIEELYKKVYLVPDKSIKYPHKSKLKHFNRALFVRRLVYTGAAAASIGLLFTIQNPFNRDDDVEKPTEVVSQNTETPKQEAVINSQKKEIVLQNQGNITLKEAEPLNAVLIPQTKTENIHAGESVQRQPVLLPKVDLSKPQLEKGDVAANQLALRNEKNYGNVEEAEKTGTGVSKKVVSLAEYAFNEVKKVIPGGVQDLADKKPVLREVTENSKKEINELLSKQVTIEKEIDEDGNLKSFAVNSSLFAFYTTKVKK